MPLVLTGRQEVSPELVRGSCQVALEVGLLQVVGLLMLLQVFSLLLGGFTLVRTVTESKQIKRHFCSLEVDPTPGGVVPYHLWNLSWRSAGGSGRVCQLGQE